MSVDITNPYLNREDGVLLDLNLSFQKKISKISLQNVTQPQQHLQKLNLLIKPHLELQSAEACRK